MSTSQPNGYTLCVTRRLPTHRKHAQEAMQSSRALYRSRFIRGYHAHTPIPNVFPVHLPHDACLSRAIQQAVLAAAGMTSVELRRRRMKPTTYDATSNISSAPPYQPPDGSPDCSASWDHQQQRAGSPSMFPTQGPRRPRLFPPASDMLLHWRKFLAGTELSAPTSPVEIMKRR